MSETLEQQFDKIATAAAAEEAAPAPVESVQAEQLAPAEEKPFEPPFEPEAAGAKAEEAPKAPETVPLAVHIRQRQRHDAEMAQLRQMIDVGNQRLGELTKVLKPEEAPIDRVSDPLGAALQGMDGLQKELSETKGLLSKREQDEQMRAHYTRFQRAVADDEVAYAEQAPDVKDAIQYAKDMKFREYTALGLEPQQAAARVQQDAVALANHAFQMGASPSEMVYRMAQALGYKTKAADGTAAKPAAQEQAEKTIEMRAAGAAKDKASGGASASEGGVSFAQLAAMDNDEFAKLTSGKNWAKLNGG